MTHKKSTCVIIVVLAMNTCATFMGCNQRETHLQLITAIKARDAHWIANALKAEGLGIDGQDATGVAPLLQAVLSKDRDTFVKLLEMGASPNLCDRRGRCVMNVAASDPDGFWLELPLKHGGDPNVINIGDRHSPNSTPLYFALMNGGVDTEQWRAENVRQLIAAGANVNHRDGRGDSPLLFAAKAANYEAVVELLNAGADPHLENSAKYSTLDWFDGRTDKMVVDEAQGSWLHRAADILIARGLIERASDGTYRRR